MNYFKVTLTLALFGGLSACEPSAPGEIGFLDICVDGITTGGDDTFKAIVGTVVPTQSNDCSASASTAITVEDDSGGSVTIGFTVQDDARVDITPSIAIAEGTEVELLFRHHMSFSSASGFVLTDEAGILVAAQQGYWGGALKEDDIDGLSISRGEFAGEVEGVCQDLESFSLVFDTDAGETEITPVGSADITIGEQSLTALAISSYDWLESGNCNISDKTDDPATWVLHR